MRLGSVFRFWVIDGFLSKLRKVLYGYIGLRSLVLDGSFCLFL